MIWMWSPKLTKNLGFGFSLLMASTAFSVRKISCSHSSPLLSQSPVDQIFISPNWGICTLDEVEWPFPLPFLFWRECFQWPVPGYVENIPHFCMSSNFLVLPRHLLWEGREVLHHLAARSVHFVWKHFLNGWGECFYCRFRGIWKIPEHGEKVIDWINSAELPGHGLGVGWG